jgi:hypothetical protein
MPENLTSTTASETDTARATQSAREARRARAGALLLALHGLIIVSLLLEIAYAATMVLVVMAPAGAPGPLWQRAPGVPFELMSVRRLYAIECWIAVGALGIYLGITEIGPRLQDLRRGR